MTSQIDLESEKQDGWIVPRYTGIIYCPLWIGLKNYCKHASARKPCWMIVQHVYNVWGIGGLCEDIFQASCTLGGRVVSLNMAPEQSALSNIAISATIFGRIWDKQGQFQTMRSWRIRFAIQSSPYATYINCWYQCWNARKLGWRGWARQCCWAEGQHKLWKIPK